MPQALMFGTTLAARVPHCWKLSWVPHPLDLSSCTFNTRVLGTRLWTMQSKYVGLEAVQVAFPQAPGSADDCPSPQPKFNSKPWFKPRRDRVRDQLFVVTGGRTSRLWLHGGASRAGLTASAVILSPLDNLMFVAASRQFQ
jgi:hypothetical protein